MPSEFEEIIRFIIKKHYNQVDKGGNPYFLHPISVALSCNTVSEKKVALLHDILEDTETKLSDLLELHLSCEEIEAIQLLTKPSKEDYMHYIKRISKNELARNVKIHDLLHNMDIKRISNPTEKDIHRNEQYKKAYDFLVNIDTSLRTEGKNT